MDAKAWYASKTIWASVLQVIVGILTATGLVSASVGAEIAAQGPELIVGAVTVVLGVVSLYGRAKADKKVTLTNKTTS